jgi:hypothetical protein
MKSLVWILTWTVIGIWSAFAWIAHSLIGVGGGLIANNADLVPSSPEVVEWTSWLATVGTSVGEWAVIGIWAVVSLLIYVIGFAVTRLLPSIRNQAT